MEMRAGTFTSFGISMPADEPSPAPWKNEEAPFFYLIISEKIMLLTW
jgi:hypothetical protein